MKSSVFICALLACAAWLSTFGKSHDKWSDRHGEGAPAAREMLVHSHNDYEQKRPFWGAYEAGADSIEADVYLVGNDLLVAHSRSGLKTAKTLRSLYLEPLRDVMRKNGGRARANEKPLQLVIDIKNGRQAFDALLKMIEQEGFRGCFDVHKNPSAARLSVGGDISEIKDFLAYPDFVFFSVPSARKLDDSQCRRVSWVSDCACIYTKWRSGPMSEGDKKKIRDAAGRAHARGLPFRLWGFPDNTEAWQLARELGLDYVNTDRPAAAVAFFAAAASPSPPVKMGTVLPPAGTVPSPAQPPKSQVRAEIAWVKPICVEKDRYIGWPSVCRLANGDVMAVFSGDRDGHVCPWGKVQMVRSSDEGETWSEPVTIANGPIDDRDAGIVQLPDGEIFVTYFTSVAYRVPGILARHPEYKRHDEKISDEVRAAALGNWAVRSRDNGRTWSRPEKLSMRGQTPHGPILLKDGSLLQFGRFFADSVHGTARERGRTRISAERSCDGGRTWEMLCSDVPDTNGENSKGQLFHEPHVVELADGTLVGMVRYHGADNCMRATFSKDGGRTWAPMAKSPLVGLPPHLIRLADGKIVCVYGRRLKSPGFGEFAAISDDGGATWDHANEISLAPSHCGDLGYPASCLLANGDILTVFYQQPEPGCKPCLMAARWKAK